MYSNDNVHCITDYSLYIYITLTKIMATRKDLIEEFNKVETKYRELSYSLYKRYQPIAERYKDNKAKLEHYLYECPECSSKMLFYGALRDLRNRVIHESERFTKIDARNFIETLKNIVPTN